MSVYVFQEEQEDRRPKNQWHNQTGNIICRTPEVRWGKPTDQGELNLLKDIETCSRTTETCSRTKKLAQGH